MEGNGNGHYPVRPNRAMRRDRDYDYEREHQVDLHHQSQSQVNYYDSYRPGPAEAEDWTDDPEEMRTRVTMNYHNNNNNNNSNNNLNRNNLHSGNGVGSGSGRRSNLRNGHSAHNGHSGGVGVPRSMTIRPNDEDMIESVSGGSRSASGSSGLSQSVSASSGYPRNLNQQYTRSEKLVKMSRIPEKFHDEKDGSEIYVMDSAFPKGGGGLRPATAYSQYSGKSRAPSEMSSVKTKTSRKGGVVVDTMSAPNPFCPNTRGVCCLLVLVNLGLILVTLGFSIVLQLFDPPFVWYCGIAFLIVGFIALIVSLLFCVHLCRESRESRRQNGLQPGELYWTHHWQKRIALPGMGTTNKERGKADDLSTVYSARTDDQDHKQAQSQSQYYDPRDQHQQQRHQSSRERDSMTPIHSYRH